MILLFLGVFVFSRGTNKILNITFFLYFLALSVWGFGVFGLASGFSATILIWLKIMETGVVFLPSTYLLFTYHLLAAEHRPKRSVVISAFVLSFTFLILAYTPYFFMGVTKVKFGYVGQPYPSPIFLVFVSFVTGSMLYGLYCLYGEMIHSKGMRLNQLLYFFLASALFWVSALSVVPTLVGMVMLGGFPIWNFTNILYGVILSYSIIRYKLIDIEVVIKRSFVYSALVALIVGVYALGTFMLQEIIRQPYRI